MNDLIIKRDVLELNAYEAIEKRNALLREIKSLIGEDLKIILNKKYQSEIDILHQELAKQTTNCLLLLSDYNKVIDSMQYLQIKNK
jgi:hypothetical protein